MKKLAAARSITLPVDGTEYAAIAEIPKAMQPSRLTDAMAESSERLGSAVSRPPTSTYAR